MLPDGVTESVDDSCVLVGGCSIAGGIAVETCDFVSSAEQTKARSVRRVRVHSNAFVVIC